MASLHVTRRPFTQAELERVRRASRLRLLPLVLPLLMFLLMAVVGGVPLTALLVWLAPAHEQLWGLLARALCGLGLVWGAREFIRFDSTVRARARGPAGGGQRCWTSSV